MLEKINHKSAPKEVVNALLTLYHQGKFDDVLSRSSQLIKEYPQTFVLHNIIGAISFEKGHKEVAIEHFRKVIELRPHHPHAYNNLGATLINLGKYQEAKSNLKKAIELQPDYAEAYNNLGNACKEMEEYNEAIQVYEKAVELNPQYYEAYNNLGVVLGKNEQYRQAIEACNKVLSIKPDYAEAYYNMGVTLQDQGKLEKAIEAYKKALSIKPDYYEAYFNIGVALQDKGNLEESIQAYISTIEINPNYIDAILNIAYAYIDLEDNISAIEYLNKLKNIQHSNLSILLKVIFLCKFEEIADYKLLYNKYCSILNKEEKTKKFINYKNQISVTTLIGFGRSGSLFLHSLLDGHPQISTLPGYFFKGWFGKETWPIFQPNFQEINWRKTLVEKICTYFEPQFNAHCKKNVIGKPNGNPEWFAKNLGFTQLGENHSEVLELDQQKFKSKFIDLSQAYDKIDSRICFELIHEAFDKAYRIPENSAQKDKTIFYHLHNPDHFEYANFMRNYPKSRIIYIIRNPIQMLESWILHLFKQLKIERDQSKSIEIYQSIYDKIYYLFEFINNPLNSIFEKQIRGVKLEDIKRKSKQTIPLISNWIGIKHSHTLYKSEFLNKKFSRPSSNFNNISGFDLRAIKAKEGRFLGEMDIFILKTLLWPLLKLYKYTNLSEKEFKINLKRVKKNLKKPMEFEQKIYSFIPGNKISLNEMEPHKKLHKILVDNHQILSANYNFQHIIKPLI